MKLDHEAAKKRAEAECQSPTFPGQSTHNLAACYLDAMAQLDKAAELLRMFVDDEECQLDHHGCCQTHRLGKPCENAEARAFLDERK